MPSTTLLAAPSYLAPKLTFKLKSQRLEAVDLLRGLLMVLMALDHTRDYFSNAAVDPTDALHSWPTLFATRWITHLCAPGFILLAGASAWLQRDRGKTKTQLSRFLVTRGLWLILVELTLITFAWQFSIKLLFLQVIWVLGAAMIVLAGLQWLPMPVIGIFGACLVFGHNLLDGIHAQTLGRWSDAWEIFHQFGPLTYNNHTFAFMAYPLIPWIGVMALGYCFGALLTTTPQRRRRSCILIGSAMLAAFGLLRATDRYGDPHHWQHLATPAQTVMSFMEVEKYPPSLHYLLATLGTLLLLYALFDKAVEQNSQPRLRGFLNVYGRVPFFYYVVHIYLLHTLALLGAALLGLNWRFWTQPGSVFFGHLSGWGMHLPGVYAVWLTAVLALYLPCRWFSLVKARRRDWWLSYL
jgi:uncharacterized membrane protein